MKKNRFLLVFTLLFLIITLSSCTKNDPTPANIDIINLAQDLNGSLGYDEPMEQLEDSVTYSVYSVDPDDFEASLLYMPTGAKADEIAVFQAKDYVTPAKMQEILEARKADQINVFKDYAPEEVVKLKNSIIKVKGSYGVFCVSPDRKKAEQIINSYFTGQ